MKTLRFTFDPLSRDAQSAFEGLPRMLEDLHHEVIYEPALRSPQKGLGLLRLAFACSAPGWMPNRWVVENVLRHAAQPGDPDEPARLQALAQVLVPRRDPLSPQVDAAVQAVHADAIARGLTHEPLVEVDGRRFVGAVGLSLLSAWLSRP